ncbi:MULTISPECIES: hypothetical protein [Kitasatospora]|uniref:hypothetical protein n=1 Tax=Kitasatospora TaxID=2063 RepID=UPI000C27DFC1|nr:hypothetical protein [Kitasatospora sp. CB02891]PJN21133.1 hypothetical protein CG736_34900 [Kitasatospora sp. CB02891]
MMLDQLLSPHAEAQFLYERTAELMIQDRLPAAIAARIVRQRIEASDVLVLAAPDQEWTVRPGCSIGPWEAGQRLWVMERLALPSAVILTDCGLPPTEIEVELPLLGERAELTEWRWIR